MPLTLSLLAGPSTSLRDDLVRCLVLRRPSLVAIAYDLRPSASGTRLVRRVLDATGLLEREELELTGCCLSCTVREDAAPAVELLTAVGRWSEAVLALPASVQPGELALVLVRRDGLPVDTVTTVVDARLLRAQLGGDDLLADRGLAAAPADRRSTAELILRQLEDADVLAVCDLHRVGTAEARLVEALLAHLAPLALQVPVGPDGTGCDDVVSTGRHDPATGALGRERLAALAVGLCPPACGVTTVRWHSDRALHSGRLREALPLLIEGVVRSRGHVWLADRPRQKVRWESAGGSLAFGDPETWDAAPDCALVLTGVGLDEAALRQRLAACLVTGDELTGPCWPDPFVDALGQAAPH